MTDPDGTDRQGGPIPDDFGQIRLGDRLLASIAKARGKT
jgi:hypothetical protein